MTEFCTLTVENTLEGLAADADVNVCELPVPMMLFPDQLRTEIAVLGSIQYTPGLDAAAATAELASCARQCISRM